MNTVYSASQVASVLGEETRNLRMWRLRGLCDLGTSTGQSHRRYTVADVCKMAAALALRDAGHALETAFNRCSGSSDISLAIDKAVAGDSAAVVGKFIITGRTYHFDGTRSIVTRLVNGDDLNGHAVTDVVYDPIDGAPLLSRTIIDLFGLGNYVISMLEKLEDEGRE